MNENMVMEETRDWIIKSLMETDAYKFSMGQAIYHHFNKDTVRWSFKCRNKDVVFTKDMVDDIRSEIDHYCTLRFKQNELEWLGKNLPWISSDYIGFLKFWHPVREEILVNEGDAVDYNGCGLAIEAVGDWLTTSMYEIAILAIVNEVYFRHTCNQEEGEAEFKRLTIEKFKALSNGQYNIGTFSEFGMRRRFSSKMQDWLVGYMADLKRDGYAGFDGFVGTSNVYLAMKHGLKAVGTMAHEYTMVVGQAHHEHNPSYSNHFMLKSWVKEYKTQNGIALTDTITTDCFLRDFDLTYATLFSGVRHDSGDPILWGEKMIEHYKRLNIDPKTKTLLFSDSLDFKRATDIKKHFDGKCKVAFGIGTYLSNPLPSKLNVVMKVTEANGAPVAKLSDCEGKGMCRDDRYVEYLRRCIDWRIAHKG